MLNFVSHKVCFSANLSIIGKIYKGTKLSQLNAGAFLFQVLNRFFPYCFQVRLNSNLHSFQYVRPKVHALIYSINMRPCKNERLDNEMGYSGKESE